jgi:hypothetical protein
MKAKVTLPNGIVVEIDATAEELSRLVHEGYGLVFRTEFHPGAPRIDDVTVTVPKGFDLQRVVRSLRFPIFTDARGKMYRQ